MKRLSLAAAAAGLLAVWAAMPVQAAVWCLSDPAVTIQLPGGSATVYVTEAVMGSQNQAALAAATVTYSTGTPTPTSVPVVIYDYIPTGAYGTFATAMVVSSKPFGAGAFYGATYGTSGTAMSVAFSINPLKPKG